MQRAQITIWLKDNPGVVAVLAICVTVAIIAAMFFGLDLSWIPEIIRSLFV